MGKRNYAKKIAALAVLTALSLITFILEGLLPAMIIPGAKPGLANIFSLIALIMYSPVEAFIVVAVRTLLGAVFAGNLSALLYSFTGGVVAMGVSCVLVYIPKGKISIMAASVAAAVAHNITQNIVFVFLSSSALTFYYMPYLILLGIISGAIVGGVTLMVFKFVPMSTFERFLGEKVKDKPCESAQ